MKGAAVSSSGVPAHYPHPWATLGRRILAGVVGGLAGGMVFGFLMARMGMFPMIASMVGSDSAGAGLIIHLIISVAAGLGLTVLFAGKFLTSYGKGAVTGLVYGVLWWVVWWGVGGLLITPQMLGESVFSREFMAAMTLVGHLMYGAVLGLTAGRVLKGRT
ncbi:hypothetical protein ACVWY0_001228 [Arthrobacter sp. UYNi723]